MKKLLQSTLVRVVCQVLAFAMLATIVPNGLTTKAYAQSGSALGSEPAKKVGVLEFINDSNRFGQIISKNATSSFIMEANKEGQKFQVEASAEDMKAKMDELGIRQPASTQDCIKLSEELELDGIIQGYIKSISIKGSGANKVATANVTIQYLDYNCGAVIMGASAKGESSARIGFTADEDTLAIEAVNKAIRQTFLLLINYNVPKATIHANQGPDSVILNCGLRNNLYPGMRMVVLRGAYPKIDENLEDNTVVTAMRIVGYIEITNVSGLDAVGKIIQQNVGVKPEDVCVGLYNDVYVSKYSTVEESINNVNSKAASVKAKKNENANQLGMILLGVAALVGLCCLFSKGGNDESGPTVETISKPGVIKVSENKNTYIQNRIVGIRLISDNGMKEYVAKYNNEDDHTVTTGQYDGHNALTFNVFNEFPNINTNEQYAYSAEWIYLEEIGEEEAKERYSKASDEKYITKFDAATDLEPSSTINANEFVEGEVFTWESTSYSQEGVNVKYLVKIWDGSNASNKITLNCTSKQLSTYQLDQVWSYFQNGGYENKTFYWNVGTINANDSNTNAYTYSENAKFKVESLPPTPPSQGKRR